MRKLLSKNRKRWRHFKRQLRRAGINPDYLPAKYECTFWFLSAHGDFVPKFYGLDAAYKTNKYALLIGNNP